VEVAIKTGLPTFCRLGRMSALTGLHKRQDLCMGETSTVFCSFTARSTELSMGVTGCSFSHYIVPNIHSIALIDLFIVLKTISVSST
jgi:hypothetical protein